MKPAVIAALLVPLVAGCFGGGPISQMEATPQSATVHDAPAYGGTTKAVAPERWLAAMGASSLPAGTMRWTEHNAWAPTLAVSGNGTLFMTGGQTDENGLHQVRRSYDGASWHSVNMPFSSYVDDFLTPVASDIHVDPDTGRMFYADARFACIDLSVSDDGGDSWIRNPANCPPGGGDMYISDILTGKPVGIPPTNYENVVYHCAARTVDVGCAASLDGGLTFGPVVPNVFGGTQVGGEDPLSPVGCETTFQPGMVDGAGNVYLASGQCGTPTVAFTHDQGITWQHRGISDVHTFHRPPFPGFSTGHEPYFDDMGVAADDEGRVYAAWIGPHMRPLMAWSGDQGLTWSEPREVGHPNVNASNHPMLAATGDGRVAVAYYGTPSGDSYQNITCISGCAAAHGINPNATWDAYLGVIADAAGDPIIATTTLNPDDHPIDVGGCILEGCGRHLLRMQMVIDPDGRPWATLLDSCDGNCSDARPPTATYSAVGTLASGPSLRTSQPLSPVAPQPLSAYEVAFGEGTTVHRAQLLPFAGDAARQALQMNENEALVPVYRGADAILLELRADFDRHAVVVLAHPDGEAVVEEASSDHAGGVIRVALTGSPEIDPGRYFAWVWGEDLATGPLGELAVSVFYDGPIPDGYSALR